MMYLSHSRFIKQVYYLLSLQTIHQSPALRIISVGAQSKNMEMMKLKCDNSMIHSSLDKPLKMPQNASDHKRSWPSSLAYKHFL